MSHVCLTAQEMCSIEEQLDVLVELCTWFGTTYDISAQEFADEYNRQERLDASEEPLDFNSDPKH